MNGRDRRALTIGAAVVVAAVLVLRVLPWAVRRLLDARRELAEHVELLARGRQDLAQAPALRDSAAALTRAGVALAPRLLAGGTSAEALADLNSRLNVAAGRAPARVERLDAVPDSSAAGRLREVRVRATLETDVRGLASLLRAVELGDAALAVERFEVTSPEPTSGERVAEVLRVEITVSGWFLERHEAATGKGET